jgi:hypothetical protein
VRQFHPLVPRLILMDRPCLNPGFVEEPPPPVRRRRPVYAILTKPVDWFVAILLARVGGRRRDDSPDHNTLGWLIHILIWRLVFVPMLVPLLVAACVFIGTHPPRWGSSVDPASRGIYYDPVAFVTADDVRLEGWLVPVTDERSIVEQREKALRARRPAVVLVHDEESNRSQMLPLVQPLRDAGFVVLVAGLRTSGASNIGGTFGLREEADVRAAVDLLRRRPGVDPNRIAVIGSGTGANAALLAAEADTKIAALVLDRPTRDGETLMAQRLVPPQPWLAWLRPLCKWGFEMAYSVDVDDLGLERHHVMLSSKPVLVFDENSGPSPTSQSGGIERIVTFLQKQMENPAQAGLDKR